MPNAGKGEAVDDDRPSAANGANGHVAKKRKRQKAMAAVAANGHVGKVAKRKPAAADRDADADGAEGGANGKGPKVRPPARAAVVAEAGTVESPVVEDVDEPHGTVEPPVVEDVDEPQGAVEPPAVDDVDEPQHTGQPPVVEDVDEPQRTVEPPALGDLDELEEFRKLAELIEEVEELAPTEANRRARRRAAKRAKAAEAKLAERAEAKPSLRTRVARRSRVTQPATPAARRAQLVATAAAIAAANEDAEAEADVAKGSGRMGKVVRRLVALVAICMLPAAVYALVVTDGPVTTLPQQDAAYLSEQLITADQRVRKQLSRLRPLHTSPAIARTRESQLTARSLSIEIGNRGGSAAERLRRAVSLEATWLDAVGSVLANPRSPLRATLVARDRALRPALAALPSTEGLRRKGGAVHLRDFAKSRVSAARKRQRQR